MSRKIWLRAAMRASVALLATGCYLLPSSGLTNYVGSSTLGLGYPLMSGGTQPTSSNSPSAGGTVGGTTHTGNLGSGGNFAPGTGSGLGSNGSLSGMGLGSGSMGGMGGLFGFPPIYP